MAGDAAEHHEGMVAAIAFESLFKLVAFLAIGVYVTFGMYDGFGDILREHPGAPRDLQGRRAVDGLWGRGWL